MTVTVSLGGLLWGAVFLGMSSPSEGQMAPRSQVPPRATTRDVVPVASVEDLPCSACHTCDEPTLEDPCLRECQRAGAAAIKREMMEQRGPDMVILDELENLYLPVPFDHHGHAVMAEMTRSCEVCHHYTPEGVRHPACKSCHEIAPAQEDMRKPSLKAAYHRQCLSCHREWSHETACEICHFPKTGLGGGAESPAVPTKDDIMGHMHPPIPEPTTKIYATKHLARPGTNVTFRHEEHIHRFGFTCAVCHHEDSCSRCHEEGKSKSGEVKTLEEHHNPCATCHDMEHPDKCAHCHWAEDEPEPPRFQHSNTGWPLNRYHRERSCRVCHERVPFTKLDRECNSCHGDWEPANFNHAVTGQELDTNHAETDCVECHADRKFDVPPTCDECHDEEEGIAFPKKRPGRVVSPATQPAR
jgi:hypothetical protein